MWEWFKQLLKDRNHFYTDHERKGVHFKHVCMKKASQQKFDTAIKSIVTNQTFFDGLSRDLKMAPW